MAAGCRSPGPTASGHGTPVTFGGRALNYKAGAGIEPGDEPIYVEGLDRWLHDVDGKPVRVSGVLVERKDIPDPEVDADGRATSVGMYGPRKILLNPKWVTSEKASGAAFQASDRPQAKEEHVTRLLDAAAIHAGQDVHEVLTLCPPYRVEFVGRYAFVEFTPVPGYHGLSLLAIDGKLVSARRWSCTQSEAWFETIGEDEKRAAWAAYDARLSGDRL